MVGTYFENGRAEAEGPEVQGQREQACIERMSVVRTVWCLQGLAANHVTRMLKWVV